MTATVRIGLLGMGNVGGALVELLQEQRSEIAGLTGLDLTITRIAVRDATKPRGELYGAELASNYQGQGLKLSKHFRAP